MDRGVFIGGGLICASFLLAVLLNEAAREPANAPEPVRKGVVSDRERTCESVPSVTSIPEGAPSSDQAADAPRPPTTDCK